MMGFFGELLRYIGRGLFFGLVDDLIAHIRDRLRRYLESTAVFSH